MSEIDERVAREVMEVCPHHVEVRHHSWKNGSATWRECTICRQTFQEGDKVTAVKAYSTNIAHAWEVVEKMQKEAEFVYCEVRASSILNSMTRGLFYCKISGCGHNIKEFAATAPLAICKAALKAKEKND
ncbi:hypothetical protein KAR91_34690 [Candidatus Pacearchaeota archaeon]|nr:hypothetical protein [Candidatus Pacearchaeota archaeon]